MMCIVLHRKENWPRLLVALLLTLVVAPSPGQIILNEVMAENVTALAHEDEFPDWVELYNAGGVSIDLGGWSLTDNLNDPTKFTFPDGTLLRPGRYLLVYCDDSNELPGLHTGFALDGKGEALALYSPANLSVPEDVLTFGLQIADYSIGRAPNASGPWKLNLPTPEAFNQEAGLSASTNLFINEWMADDAPNDDWIELYNDGPQPADLSGYVFTDDLGVPANRALPNLSFILGDGFIQFIADDLDQSDNDHLDFRLSANGETLTLYQADRVTVVDQVKFDGQLESVSQGRLPDGGPEFVFFVDGRETPGASNFLPLTHVVVNEVLSHTDPPLEDAIELINLSSESVDISHWWLSDSRSDVKKYRVPPGTVLSPGGFKVFYEGDFNPSGTGNSPDFSLNSSQGDEVYIHTGDAEGDLSGFRNVVKFPATGNGISMGRHTNSLGEVVFRVLKNRTFGVDHPTSISDFRLGQGLPNASPLVGPLVINEIMYHPLEGPEGGDNTKDEYLEILNITNVTVQLYDPDFPTNRWKIVGGVNFEFPPSVSLPGGESLLVVNFNPANDPEQLAAFRSLYGIPAQVAIYGPYEGKLDNRADRVEFIRPDTPQGPDRPDFGFVPFLPVDLVEYEDRNPWPGEADETGRALVRIKPEDDGNDPINWRAGEPTPGRQVLRFASVTLQGNELVMRFQALVNQGYAVQYRSSLTSGAWMNLIDVPPTPATRMVEVVDEDGLVPPARFYRLVTPY